MLDWAGEGEVKSCWRTCPGPTLPPHFCHFRGKVLSCPRPPDLQDTGKMGNMATEIVAFLLTISGWILVSSTLPTDYWKVSSVDGTVITTATFWSNLWKTCVTDSTGVSNCKDFPSMLALDGEFWDDYCQSSVWSSVYQSYCVFLMNCASATPDEILMPKILNTCCFGMNDHHCKQMHLELDISCSDSGFRAQTFKVKGHQRHISVNEPSWTDTTS